MRVVESAAKADPWVFRRFVQESSIIPDLEMVAFMDSAAMSGLRTAAKKARRSRNSACSGRFRSSCRGQGQANGTTGSQQGNGRRDTKAPSVRQTRRIRPLPR
jgi:hypothetical protein